jgi:hypothetical protein
MFTMTKRALLAAVAINALLANPNQWECVHVVGTSSTSATAAASLEPAIDSVVQTAATNHQYVAAVMEVPTTGTVKPSSRRGRHGLAGSACATCLVENDHAILA